MTPHTRARTRCALCKRPARYGAACDECRARVRAAPKPKVSRPRRRGSRRRAQAAVDATPLREAFLAERVPVSEIAGRVGWSERYVRDVLARDELGALTALRLGRALHLMPVEIGL